MNRFESNNLNQRHFMDKSTHLWTSFKTQFFKDIGLFQWSCLTKTSQVKVSSELVPGLFLTVWPRAKWFCYQSRNSRDSGCPGQGGGQPVLNTRAATLPNARAEKRSGGQGSAQLEQSRSKARL